jgi:hypothetical protein
MNRSFLAALIAAFLVLAPITIVSAQMNPPPPAPAVQPDHTAPAAPSADNNGAVSTDTRGDDASASALPRSTVERTTIFGLSPAAAIIIGGALLLIVILAIMAMGRSDRDDTYVDPRGRF